MLGGYFHFNNNDFIIILIGLWVVDKNRMLSGKDVGGKDGFSFHGFFVVIFLHAHFSIIVNILILNW